jgi:hypothetical protein
MFDLPSFTWLLAKDTAKLSKGSAWSFTPDSERTQGYRFSHGGHGDHEDEEGKQ